MTTEIHTAARARFEEWAAIDAPHLPPDPVDALQVQLARWEVAQPFHVASALPVGAGCSEEAGELADAESHDEVEDAIGDLCIYAAQVATRNRLAMSAIFELADEVPPAHAEGWRELCSAQGLVAHLVLKREQRIREGALPDEEYRERLALALAGLIGAAERAHDKWHMRPFPRACYLSTGAQVLARNWTANPTTGAAAPGA